MRRAAIFLLALLVVGGCGGGGGTPLTREEYATKADALCAKYNDQTEKLGAPSNLSDLGDTADKTIDILDNALGELRKLKPPTSEQSTVDEWLAQFENLKDDLAEIRDQANDNDIQGVQAVVPRATQHNNRANELATQLGMSVCNKD